MSAALDVSRPTPLRLAGFLFTAVGGLLIAWGAISDWATVVFLGGSFSGSATKGIDVVEGQIALAFGVILLVAIVVLRLARTTGARRAIALLVLLCAAGALAIGIVDIVRADDRFGGYGVEKIAQQLSEASGVPLEQALRDVQLEVDRAGSIDIGLGLWLVVAGGAIGVVGGLLDLAWVGRERLREAGLAADSSG